MARIFLRGADCVFLCYDVTRDESFESLDTHLEQVRNECPENALLYLVGTKCELESSREVFFDRALEYAKSRKIHKFVETSAKASININDFLFECAVKDLI